MKEMGKGLTTKMKGIEKLDNKQTMDRMVDVLGIRGFFDEIGMDIYTLKMDRIFQNNLSEWVSVIRDRRRYYGHS